MRWLQAREQELLPTHYVHVVFTLPRELAPLALQNKRLIYNLLFHASAETLLEIARDPRHLGAEIGFFSVLHTWDQRLQHHPHVHCVLAAGGLAPDRSRWISSRRSFFLPVKVLGRVFRGKFVAGLKTAFHAGALQFHGHLLPLAESRAFASWLRLLFRHDWVVYAKRPFGGPEHVLRYLGAYTHRVAISNSRLVALSEGNVTFRWRDSAHGNKKRLMALPVEEFLRRFLLHLLPRGFMRIRNFGFLANRRRAELLPLCLRLLQSSDHPAVATASPRAAHPLAVAMSAVRRNHARCRTPLRRATPAPISASSQPVRRLNPHLQPRISLVLRRAHWFCVSQLSECSMVLRFRLSDARPHAHSLCHPLLKPQPSDRNCKLANDQDRLI